uniref:Uncharacterized protein n=1 Tax=Arundo donax TaxID=35708 RepID=A0A0A9C5V4_ARUDO
MASSSFRLYHTYFTSTVALKFGSASSLLEVASSASLACRQI